MSGDKTSDAGGPTAPEDGNADAAPANDAMPQADPVAGPNDGGLPADDGAEDAAPDWHAEAASLKDQMLRALAETENVRRRAQRDMAEARKFGPAPLARDLLAVADNLQRALAAVPDDARQESDSPLARLVEGVELVARELDQMLARHNIGRVEALGQPFDHNRHEAMMQMDDASVPANTVVREMQAGYVLHDRLLRPAMVAVSRGGPAGAATATVGVVTGGGDATDTSAGAAAKNGAAKDGADAPSGHKGETLDTKA